MIKNYKFISQIPVFRSDLPKPATMAGIKNKKSQRGQNGAKVLFLNMRYKPAKIYPKDLNLDNPKWYVRYSFLNPSTQKFERFKVYEDINRYDGDDKILYATILRDAVNQSLREGFDPFAGQLQVTQVVQAYQEKKVQQQNDKRHYTILHALNLFLVANV